MIDLIGYTLEDAKRILKENGYKKIVVEKTTSPRNREKQIDDKTARVIRIKEERLMVHILVCI